MFGASRDNSAASSTSRQGAPGTSGTPQYRVSAYTAVMDSVIMRVLAYYVVLFAAAFAVWGVLPAGAKADALHTFAPMLERGRAGATSPAEMPLSRSAAAEQLAGMSTHEPVAVAAVVAAIGAFLLALPVAWVYMFTHHKKGYRQSSVHTLVLLPLVVASVTVLVKNSLPLAFALAGIVAAVRFRTTLDDAKDAVYLFLATGLGLAAGVELDVAVALSMTFNGIVLVLWYTDFARTPPRLEGLRAQRQMDRALAIANRTSQFVARIDREILQAMAPEQLDALAERVGHRRAQADPDLPGGSGKRFDARLCIVTTDVEALRECVEPALEENVKRWRFRGVRPSSEAGSQEAVVEYEVRWLRDAPPGVVLDAVRDSGAPYVVRVTVARDDVAAPLDGAAADDGVRREEEP